MLPGSEKKSPAAQPAARNLLDSRVHVEAHQRCAYARPIISDGTASSSFEPYCTMSFEYAWCVSCHFR